MSVSSTDPDALPQRRCCALPGCQIYFVVTAQAPHKKFCSSEHRNEFHGAELREARAELRKQRKMAK